MHISFCSMRVTYHMQKRHTCHDQASIEVEFGMPMLRTTAMIMLRETLKQHFMITFHINTTKFKRFQGKTRNKMF